MGRAGHTQSGLSSLTRVPLKNGKRAVRGGFWATDRARRPPGQDTRGRTPHGHCWTERPSIPTWRPSLPRGCLETGPPDGTLTLDLWPPGLGDTVFILLFKPPPVGSVMRAPGA